MKNRKNDIAFIIIVLGIIILSWFLIALRVDGQSRSFTVSTSEFGGLRTGDPNSMPAGVARDMANFDIVTTLGGRKTLKLRDGFSRMGDGILKDNINGIFVFSPSSLDRHILVAADTNLYRYDEVRDSMIVATIPMPNIAGETAWKSGGSSIIGTTNSNSWWELSNYSFTQIKIDTGAPTEANDTFNISQIWTNEFMELDAVNDQPLLGGACTLISPTVITLTSSPLDRQKPIYTDMLQDTLVITMPTRRIKYAPVIGGITWSKVADSCDNQGLNSGPDSAEFKVYKASGDPSVRRYGLNSWIQVTRDPNWGEDDVDSVPYMNIAVHGRSHLASSPNWFVAITHPKIREVLVNPHKDGTSAGKVGGRGLRYRIIPDSIAKFTDTIVSCKITNITSVDTIFYGDNPASFRTRCVRIYDTDLAGFPGSWPLDSLLFITHIAQMETTTTVDPTHDWAVFMDTTDAGVNYLEICKPVALDLWNDGDSLYIVRMYRATFPVADTLKWEDWTWPVQFAFSPTRLAYFGNDSVFTTSTQGADSLGPSWLKILHHLTVKDSVDQYVGVAVDDGRAISAGIYLGNYTFIHKEGQEIYQITHDDVGRAGEIATTNSGVAAVSQKGIGQYRGQQVFVGPGGLYIGVGGGMQNVGLAIEGYFLDSIGAGLNDVELQINDDRAYLSYAQENGDTKNRVLVYDFLTGEWVKYELKMDNMAILESRGAGVDTILFSDPPLDQDTGKVFVFGRGTDDTGVNIVAHYLSPWRPSSEDRGLFSIESYNVTYQRDPASEIETIFFNDHIDTDSFVIDTITDAVSRWKQAHRYVEPFRLSNHWSWQIRAHGGDSTWISDFGVKFVRRSGRPVFD